MSDSQHYENLPDSEWDNLGRFTGPEAKKVLARLESVRVPVRVDFHDGRRLLSDDEKDAARGAGMAQGIYIRVPRPLRQQAYDLRDEALGTTGLVEEFNPHPEGEGSSAPEPGQTFLDVNGQRVVSPVEEADIDEALREMDQTEGGGYLGLHLRQEAVLQVNGNSDFGFFLILHPGPESSPLRTDGDLGLDEARAALLGLLAEGAAWRGPLEWVAM